MAEICRNEVVEGNAIRAQVTSRAKSPKSLEGKLRRFATTGRKLILDVDSVFAQIRDLAAVRIATYEQRHEEQVVQLVCKRFIDAAGCPPVHERKDKNLGNPANFYRASHVEVFLTPSDIVGTYSNVVDVPCEVQVCSMMAHVWNEIEHDLGYKTTAGALSEQEKNLLIMLGQSVRVGDGTIASLFAETERRQREQGGVFADVYDFVARLRGWFPGVDFGRNAGALFEALQPIRLVSPDSIRKLLDTPEPMTEAARASADLFSADLQGRSETRYSIDPEFFRSPISPVTPEDRETPRRVWRGCGHRRCWARALVCGALPTWADGEWRGAARRVVVDRETRNAIERATQRGRTLLEDDFAAQLEGDFDVHRDGFVAAKAGGHLSARQAFQRERIVAAIDHKRAAGMNAADSVADYLRDAAFTTLNRFVALKMLEARDLVQECITKGELSAGYREFSGMAPTLPLLPDSAGYRLYIESLFDELSTEVKVLFDRRDPASVLWPKRATFEQLLEVLNGSELAGIWGEDETIGWVYQFFNGQDERRKMREESQAPRNSRELAIRNQFFTPRYVVQFLTDNTLGRIWYEMRGTNTALGERCEYMAREPAEKFAPRGKKDPRDLRVLDPASGSGHFLLYAFDLLVTIYEEAHADRASPKSEVTGRTLAEDYPNLGSLRKALPGLILAHNLHGVDIDHRCAQIAQLALWIRAQRAYRDFGISRAERARIRRSNIVVAEPLVADGQIVKEFVAKLAEIELSRVFIGLVDALTCAGDTGLLLRVEQLIGTRTKRGRTGDLFSPAEARIRATLARFADDDHGERLSTRGRLFADDAAHGVGLLAVAEKKFDVILMNPPFGDPTPVLAEHLDREFPRTKYELAAAFLERSLELASGGGRIGWISSRTWMAAATLETFRRELLIGAARLELVADLGIGVLDSALVETAACVAAASPIPRGSARHSCLQTAVQ